MSITLLAVLLERGVAPTGPAGGSSRGRGSSKLRKPCCMRSATVLKLREVAEHRDDVAAMSSLAKPAQAVAQKTKLCSFAIACTLPALTSLGAAEQAVAVERRPRRRRASAGSSAERGMLQTKVAVRRARARAAGPGLSKRELPAGRAAVGQVARHRHRARRPGARSRSSCAGVQVRDRVDRDTVGRLAGDLEVAAGWCRRAPERVVADVQHAAGEAALARDGEVPGEVEACRA